MDISYLTASEFLWWRWLTVRNYSHFLCKVDFTYNFLVIIFSIYFHTELHFDCVEVANVMHNVDALLIIFYCTFLKSSLSVCSQLTQMTSLTSVCFAPLAAKCAYLHANCCGSLHSKTNVTMTMTMTVNGWELKNCLPTLTYLYGFNSSIIDHVACLMICQLALLFLSQNTGNVNRVWFVKLWRHWQAYNLLIVTVSKYSPHNVVDPLVTSIILPVGYWKLYVSIRFIWRSRLGTFKHSTC